MAPQAKIILPYRLAKSKDYFPPPTPRLQNKKPERKNISILWTGMQKKP